MKNIPQIILTDIYCQDHLHQDFQWINHQEIFMYMLIVKAYHKK